MSHQELADGLALLASDAERLDDLQAAAVLRATSLLARLREDRALLKLGTLLGAAVLVCVPRPRFLQEASQAILRHLAANPLGLVRGLALDELTLALGHEHAKVLRLEAELAAARVRLARCYCSRMPPADQAFAEGSAPGEASVELGSSGGP